MPLKGEATEPTYLNLVPIGPGASKIHQAHHSVFGRDVIQKTVPRSALAPDALAEHEPRLLEQMDHPAIPRIYEAQIDPDNEGYVTFVMDVVGDFGGGAVVLGQELPLGIGECVAVALDLLAALDYLHVVRGVVHRDLKPNNIRLAKERRRAWLIDFNLVGRLSAEGSVKGVRTPLFWIAPEVADTQRYDVRSELYAFSLVMYELLRGRQLGADYPLEKIEKRLTAGRRGFPDRFFNLFPTPVPAGLRQILSRGMARDPGHRWATAGEMRRALNKLVFVDWDEDSSRPGRWVGTWPSSLPVDARMSTEVTLRDLKRGPNAGLRRARARYMPGASWRRLPGLGDRLIGGETDLVQYFEDVERRLARLRPTK